MTQNRNPQTLKHVPEPYHPQTSEAPERPEIQAQREVGQAPEVRLHLPEVGFRVF